MPTLELIGWRLNRFDTPALHQFPFLGCSKIDISKQIIWVQRAFFGANSYFVWLQVEQGLTCPDYREAQGHILRMKCLEMAG